MVAGPGTGRLSGFGPEFEVIVDYKGMRRPSLKAREWGRYEWQLRTYAWLRRAQPEAKPIAAGVVLFLNELAPSMGDLETLLDETRAGETDVPATGEDLQLLKRWRKGRKTPRFSEAFRRERSILVVSMDDAGITRSLNEFDGVVSQIETAVSSEIGGRGITQAWTSTYLGAGNPPPEDRVCTACDFKTFCPILERRGKRKNPEAP